MTYLVSNYYIIILKIIKNIRNLVDNISTWLGKNVYLTILYIKESFRFTATVANYSSVAPPSIKIDAL